MYANQLAFLNDVIDRRATETSMDNPDPPLPPNSEVGSPLETSDVPETPDEPVA